jgi:FixJ family two-component response regulator
LVQGKANKQIAAALAVSVRTVESRRREILNKMGADSLPELFRLVTDAEREN